MLEAVVDVDEALRLRRKYPNGFVNTEHAGSRGLVFLGKDPGYLVVYENTLSGVVEVYNPLETESLFEILRAKGLLNAPSRG